MSTKPPENDNNPSLNSKNQKSEDIKINNNTKSDGSTKLDSSFKKLHLPTIKKNSLPTIPVSSVTKRIKKSQSQLNLIRDNKKINIYNPNNEREKVLLAKYSLARINARINDLSLSYKKLFLEKEDNLNIIKNAVSSDDPTFEQNLSLKIEQLLEEVLKYNNFYRNKLSLSTGSYENIKYSEKTEETKEKINKSVIKEGSDNLNFQNSSKENEDKKEELNENNTARTDNNIQNNNQQNNNNNDENKKEEIDNNAKENNNNNNESNQEIKNKHDFSAETRSEDINKLNNSHILNNNNTSNHNININNSLEEQINSIKEIIEEKDEEKNIKEGEKTIQIDRGFFEKSNVPKRLINVLRVKSELSLIRHKLINIEQKLKIKDEEIDELKSRAKMKNIVFQKSVLDSKIVILNRIKTKNKELAEISLPNKTLMKNTLKKELQYYTELNKTFLVGNRDAEEDFVKKKNEFEEKKKFFTSLEAKINNMKYKYSALKLNDLKKKETLEKIKQKINLIDAIKEIIEIDKQTILQKKKEVEEAKKLLENKIEEYNQIKEKKENKYKETNNMQREINSKIAKQHNEINKIKKEIKEIDILIFKEANNYQNINKKDRNAVNQMLIYKNQPSNEFLKFLKQVEKNIYLKQEEEKKNRFKKLKIGKKMSHNIISKIKRKPPEKKEDKESSENSLLLKEKLEYYLNSKEDKKEKEEVKNDEKKEEKKDEKREEKKVEKEEVKKDEKEMEKKFEKEKEKKDEKKEVKKDEKEGKKN